jgi:hypothetical protein
LTSRRLYQALGFVCGFIVIDYGFNVLSVGFPGARAFTSEFLAGNLLLGGSALVFVSLYYLLKPASPSPTLPAPPATPQLVTGRPDVGVELIVEEETPPKPGFYKTIEYIAYFFTILGLISAADLILQVFIRSIYNEARWWVEVLLVTFGVLAYTIFGSVGRLGLQEEAKLAKLPSAPKSPSQTQAEMPAPPVAAAAEVTPLLSLVPNEFSRNAAGEYEKQLSGESYDMFRVDPDVVTVWREDRRGIRSVYLAGPYELTKKMLQEYLSGGEELRVGILVLSTDTIRSLLELTEKPRSEPPTVSVPHEE